MDHIIRDLRWESWEEGLASGSCWGRIGAIDDVLREYSTSTPNLEKVTVVISGYIPTV